MASDLSGAMLTRPEVNPSAPAAKKNGAHNSAVPQTQATW